MKESRKNLHQWLMHQNTSWSEFCFSYIKKFSDDLADLEELFKFARAQKDPQIFIQLTRSIETLKSLIPKESEKLLQLYIFDCITHLKQSGLSDEELEVIESEVKPAKLYRTPMNTEKVSPASLKSLHDDYILWCRQKHLNHKNNLILKLQEAATHRLVDQQKIILAELLRLSPQDGQLQSQSARVQTEAASELISKYRFTQDTDPKETLSVSDREWCDLIKNQMLKKVEDPQTLYEYVILFEMMGAYQHALEILNLLPDSERRLLKELEILHLSERFAEALACVLKAEMSPHLQPANLLFVKYIEAHSLWNLGEQEKGIKLLSEIVSARADYKNASTLLTVWREFMT